MRALVRAYEFTPLMVYQVIKHRGSGKVEFTATSHSQMEPRLGPVLRLGWLLFDMGLLVRQRLAEDKRQRPQPAPLDRFALYRYDPARSRLHAS